jgi:hypothetical protein
LLGAADKDLEALRAASKKRGAPLVLRIFGDFSEEEEEEKESLLLPDDQELLPLLLLLEPSQEDDDEEDEAEESEKDELEGVLLLLSELPDLDLITKALFTERGACGI